MAVPVLILCMIGLGYATQRTQHLQLTGLLFLGFGVNWFLYKSALPLRQLLITGMVARGCLLFMEPNLSEDIYRYIWDGQLMLHGYDPFAQLPADIAASNEWPDGLTPELYERLNSKNYFTVYPPMAQYFFMCIAWIGQTSVFGQIVLFRGMILIFEAGSLYLLSQLAGRFSDDPRSILLYALNPAVILELTGNLHLEAFLLFFILLILVFQTRLRISGMAHGLAIAVKLIPLIFLPLMVFRVDWKRASVYLLVTFVTMGLLIYPIITPGLISGMSESVELYFKTFEFNASYYFVVREIGFWRKGYNMIAEIGPALAFVSFLSIMIYSWLARNDRAGLLPVHLGFIWMIYLGLSTTVHPWYVLPMVGILSLTTFRYAYLWSFTVMWSYLGYTATGYSPPWIFIVLEYLLVYALMFYEISKEKNQVRFPDSLHSGV